MARRRGLIISDEQMDEIIAILVEALDAVVPPGVSKPA